MVIAAVNLWLPHHKDHWPRPGSQDLWPLKIFGLGLEDLWPWP